MREKERERETGKGDGGEFKRDWVRSGVRRFDNATGRIFGIEVLGLKGKWTRSRSEGDMKWIQTFSGNLITSFFS